MRIAKAQQLDDQLLSLALQAPVSVKLDAAEYFEARNMNAEAVLLLQNQGESFRQPVPVLRRMRPGVP